MFLFSCAVFWIGIVIFTKLMNKSRPTQKESNLRIWSYFASMIHAIMCQMIFFHNIFFACSIPGENFTTSDICFDQTSAAMQLYYVASLSFFVNDLITLVPIFGNESTMVKETKLHHMMSLSALTGAILIGRWIGTIVGCIVFTELSTIFLDVRAIMKELDIETKYNKCFIINGLLLLASFFFSRVVFLSWLTFSKLLPWLFKYDWTEIIEDYGLPLCLFAKFLLIFYLTLYCMNIIWFYKMQKGVRRYLNTKKETNSASENSNDNYQRNVDEEEQG